MATSAAKNSPMAYKMSLVYLRCVRMCGLYYDVHHDGRPKIPRESLVKLVTSFGGALRALLLLYLLCHMCVKNPIRMDEIL